MATAKPGPWHWSSWLACSCSVGARVSSVPSSSAFVFGDFLVWTMWAAMNNLRHGEEPEDVTLPALLTVLSLTGLVACWAALARRRQPRRVGWPWS